jgi:hypothetical protein
MILSALAGGKVAETAVINHSQEPLLNIVTLVIQNVPAGTQQLTLTLTSPAQPHGDSVILAGFNVSYPCSKPVTVVSTFDTFIPFVVKPLPLLIATSPISVYVGLPLTITLTLENINSQPLPNLILESHFSDGLMLNDIWPTWLPCVNGRQSMQCVLQRLRPGQSHAPIILATLPITSGQQSYAANLLPAHSSDFAIGGENVLFDVRNCLNNGGNRSFSGALGPLLPNHTYCADLDTNKADYYYVNIVTTGTLTVSIDNPMTLPGVPAKQKLRLYGYRGKILRTPTAAAICCRWRSQRNEIIWQVTPGIYYIGVEAKDYAFKGEPYGLQWEFGP